MKKLLIPTALLLSCFFIGCATTEKTVDTNKTSYEAEKEPGVEPAKKSEPTETKEKAPETKPVETKQPETKQAETKQTETKQPETKQPAQTEKKQEEPKKEPEKTTPAPAVEETVTDYGIKDVGSLDAANRTAKFTFQVPSTFAVYKPSKYRAAPESRIEVLYVDSKKNELTVVKGAGNLDVSIDETSYNDIQFVNYGGIRIMLKGKGEEKFNVATWTSGDYSYSVETNVAFPKDVLFALIQELY